MRWLKKIANPGPRRLRALQAMLWLERHNYPISIFNVGAITGELLPDLLFSYGTAIGYAERKGWVTELKPDKYRLTIKGRQELPGLLIDQQSLLRPLNQPRRSLERE